MRCRRSTAASADVSGVPDDDASFPTSSKVRIVTQTLETTGFPRARLGRAWPKECPPASRPSISR
ncbi:MAG: hypothetical protein EDX89_21300 [Acidobacteria bacterium]|nr:MAG: hypothetical protein EDX89_21300 [Acidobacteriota bacterium]